MDRVPTIAALLPVYNAAATLERALGSIAAGSDVPDHIVAVDDGSADATCDILNHWKDRLPLEVLRLPSNRGLREALNAGLSRLRADFVARLDADDEWLPGHVETLRRALAGRPNVALCSTAYSLRDGAGREQTVTPADITGLIRDNFIGHSAVCFRREAAERIGGYQSAVFEDYATWIRLAETPDDYLAIPDCTVRIHVLPNSLSRMSRKRSLALRYELQQRAFGRYARFLSSSRRAQALAFLLACRVRLAVA